MESTRAPPPLMNPDGLSRYSSVPPPHAESLPPQASAALSMGLMETHSPPQFILFQDVQELTHSLFLPEGGV